MEELQDFSKIIQKHAKEEGVVMDSQSVINFLDHISLMAGDCDECAEAMKAYTAMEVTKNV